MKKAHTMRDDTIEEVAKALKKMKIDGNDVDPSGKIGDEVRKLKKGKN
jgi:hypothetical protein